MKMEHYICKGTCGGASEKPGVCQDTNCPLHGVPLVRCGCEGLHMHKKNKEEPMKEKRNM